MGRKKTSGGMIGEELRDIRQQLGLDRKKMAEQMGLSNRTIERLERDWDTITPTVGKFANLMLRFQELFYEHKRVKSMTRGRFLEEEEKRARRRQAWEDGEI